MKHVAIYGKTPEKTARLRKELKEHGFTFDARKPNLVISYGGDGTFLRAERKYPGIPKALFRFSKICKKCHDFPIDHAIELLKKRKFTLSTHNKLEATAGKHKLLAVNDVIIRNKDVTQALRFTLTVNGKQIDDEFLGDGIVVATTFGSTGYFYSITRKTFSKGIGLAFNNPVKKQSPLFLKDNARIVLKVTRGEAVLAIDNGPQRITVKEGKLIHINVSRKKTKLISF